jgi:CspA family cold shock protein
MQENLMPEELFQPYLSGQVVWFSHGIGFIKPDHSDKDIFVHHTDINQQGYRNLNKGDIVSYQIGTNHKGQPKAIKVSVLK